MKKKTIAPPPDGLNNNLNHILCTLEGMRNHLPYQPQTVGQATRARSTISAINVQLSGLGQDLDPFVDPASK